MAASTYFDQVQQLYIAYFGRPADPVGLVFWATQIDTANGSPGAMIAGFASSSESNALYAGVSTQQKITAIYVNLFNRQPEPAGLAFWVAQIESGALTQAQAAYQMQSSAGPGDALAVVNKLAIAKSFTAQLDTPSEISGYSGATAAASGRAFLASVDATPTSLSNATASLSASVATATGTTIVTPVTPTPVDTAYTLNKSAETLTGGAGNDTFIGTLDASIPASETFNKGDSLDGGLGTDTLSLTVTGATASSWPAATLTNIEQLQIRDQHTGGSVSTFDLAGVSGLKGVASNVSTAAVAFNNVQAGTMVAMLGDKTSTLGALNFTMSKTTDAISLLFDGGVKTTSVNSGSAQATTVTISSTGAANQVGLIDLGKTSSVTKLVVNASTDLTTVLSANDYASTATLTLTGQGKVDLGTTLGFNGSSVDASVNSGGLTIALSNNIKSYIGSSGADRLLGTATIANTSSIDGGAGIDTVLATLINSGNAAAFKSFELLDLAGTANSGSLDVSQLVNSKIAGVLISAPSNGTYTLDNLKESASGFDINVTGSTPGSFLTLGFDTASVAGSSDVLNYTFNNQAGKATDAGSITSQGIEAITINSGGVTSGNVLRIVDNSAQSIVITGDQALNLTVASQTGGGASNLNKIDGSAATGALTITTAATNAAGGQAALVVKTGSGNDSITATTTVTTGSVGSTITSGTGSDTILVSGARAQDTTAVQFTTITDFSAGDQLFFGNILNAAGLTFTAAKFSPAAPANLSDALTQALSGVSTNIAVWFNYETDTYIVHNADATAGFSAADVVIKLTGTTVDLSNATTSGMNLVFG
ncbi:DUF4214 domain-containing protein [Pseudomonas syringae]|uniref:DUF4214 domain-containing protein n=1 Tax=Pseudomonas syringae TaxID=317 RepID=A0A085VNX7_PSESX|nr:DUF4214 domain-containing protein [Pseudomonas syringae]KFE57140.1 hypothetical protein IV01_05515 [Pseudomonas syringae]